MSNIDDILLGITNSLKRLQEAQEAQLAEQSTIEKVPQPKSTDIAKFTNEYFDKAADDYIEFTYKNPTIYHVVQHFKNNLN